MQRKTVLIIELASALVVALGIIICNREGVVAQLPVSS